MVQLFDNENIFQGQFDSLSEALQYASENNLEDVSVYGYVNGEFVELYGYEESFVD